MSVHAPITQILANMNQGVPGAMEEFMSAVYADLRKLAEVRLRGQRAGVTLQPTMLVNEAYLRLFDDPEQPYENRRHFFFAAARAMRNVVVEEIRKRNALMRGGGKVHITLDEENVTGPDAARDLMDIDVALQELEDHDRGCADIVWLRFYAGCSYEVIAELLQKSEAKVRREWLYARGWLLQRMQERSG